MLILFSAGNEGVDNDGERRDRRGLDRLARDGEELPDGRGEREQPPSRLPAPSRAGTFSGASSPKFATMGAAGHVSDNVDGMAAFSSRGPVDVERIKPDVVAPAPTSCRCSPRSSPTPRHRCTAVSQTGHPPAAFYCWSGGTSMATPLVAGAAALVRQHLVEQRGHLNRNASRPARSSRRSSSTARWRCAGQFPGEVPAGAEPWSAASAA